MCKYSKTIHKRRSLLIARNILRVEIEKAGLMDVEVDSHIIQNIITTIKQLARLDLSNQI